MRGEQSTCTCFLHRGQRISAIATLCCDGVIALELREVTYNGDKFLDFIIMVLIPEIHQFVPDLCL